MCYDQEEDFSTVSNIMQNNSKTEKSVFIVYNIFACIIIGWALPNMRVLLYFLCTHISFYKFIAFPIDLNSTLDFGCFVTRSLYSHIFACYVACSCFFAQSLKIK